MTTDTEQPICPLCHRAHPPDALGEWYQCFKHMERLLVQHNDAICQIAGKALGYPWFKDDQKNFPGATEADGVRVGEHVAESIVEELARRFLELRGIRRAKLVLRRLFPRRRGGVSNPR